MDTKWLKYPFTNTTNKLFSLSSNPWTHSKSWHIRHTLIIHTHPHTHTQSLIVTFQIYSCLQLAGTLSFTLCLEEQHLVLRPTQRHRQYSTAPSANSEHVEALGHLSIEMWSYPDQQTDWWLQSPRSAKVWFDLQTPKTKKFKLKFIGIVNHLDATCFACQFKIAHIRV